MRDTHYLVVKKENYLTSDNTNQKNTSYYLNKDSDRISELSKNNQSFQIQRKIVVNVKNSPARLSFV